MPKGVTDAAKKLPAAAREPFLRAWKAAGCVDLYEGRLEQYLQVIAQSIEQSRENERSMVNNIHELYDKLENLKKELILGKQTSSNEIFQVKQQK